MDGMDATSVITTLVLNIANIVILFIIVRSLVYKPVKKFMSDREASIKAQLDEAEERLAEAESVKAQAEAELSNAAASADEKRRSIIEAADIQAQEIKSEAMADADRIRESANVKAAHAEEQMMTDMRNKIADLSIEIAGRILEREVKKSDNADIIEKYFDKVG